MEEKLKEELTFEEKLNIIIERLNSPKKQKELNDAFEYFISNKQIMTEYDILKCFNISINTYNVIQQSLRKQETTSEQIEKIKYILNSINGYKTSLNMVNDKSIKSGARIGKNTMTYLLKEEQEDNDLIIINVSVVGDDPLTIEKLKSNDGVKKNGN